MSRPAKDQLVALKAGVTRRPFEAALAAAFMLVALYAGGYQVGKARALADNRADLVRSAP